MEQKQENTVVKIFEASTEPAADHTYIYIYTPCHWINPFLWVDNEKFLQLKAEKKKKKRLNSPNGQPRE